MSRTMTVYGPTAYTTRDNHPLLEPDDDVFYRAARLTRGRHVFLVAFLFPLRDECVKRGASTLSRNDFNHATDGVFLDGSTEIIEDYITRMVNESFPTLFSVNVCDFDDQAWSVILEPFGVIPPPILEALKEVIQDYSVCNLKVVAKRCKALFDSCRHDM